MSSTGANGATSSQTHQNAESVGKSEVKRIFLLEMKEDQGNGNTASNCKQQLQGFFCGFFFWQDILFVA